MKRSDDLLAGLDDIDRAALGHAYGSAEDVPGRLRTVCGPDDEARENAFRSLFGNIFHQGSRYSASPYAVPFLTRIAVAGRADARVDARLLLTRLAVDRHDEYDLPLGIGTAAWRAAAISPEESMRRYEEQIAAETDEERLKKLRDGRAYCAAGHPVDAHEGALRSYDAVRAQLPVLLELLGDPAPEIRTSTAYLLGWFPEEAEAALPPLLARLDGEHPAAAPALPPAQRVAAELAAFSTGPVPEAATAHHAGDLHSYTVRSLLCLMGAAEDPNGILLEIVRALPRIEETEVVPRPLALRAGNLLEALFEPADTAPVSSELSPLTGLQRISPPSRFA
ncbi:hypothetical protein [Kitasatospora sp. NPDC093679]|uniref:hypothetical protein n=1 Tax=Kitasatospora sp. NPDC093679 TaxID=3154983 RepID=UPI00343DCDE0